MIRLRIFSALIKITRVFVGCPEGSASRGQKRGFREVPKETDDVF
jgi:hypothetical protein